KPSFLGNAHRINTIECLTIEISKPNSKSFLVSTWYRPESPVSVFDTFENVIAKVDAEYKEIYLLGDTNCNFLPGANDPNAKHLRDILELYGLAQLITKPTRITASSRSLIDHCITNCVDKIKHSGVIHLGISDHSLVFMIRKSNSFRNGGHKTIKTREWKLRTGCVMVRTRMRNGKAGRQISWTPLTSTHQLGTNESEPRNPLGLTMILCAKCESETF
ncbi:uncharacterized protein LOC114574952, partial [Exaiptasia diaphana]|uniref:Endonuclease/exonuclease/phosphatase domain-containing protein n=1 Tax=Exaiptasia diaphana TaxID=2652724 RepID=A0A913YHQ5_EXADI